MAVFDKTVDSCRICLDTNCVDLVLLKENSDWYRLYCYCSGLSLTSEDKPRAICYDCARLLQKFALFKDKCIESDKVWKQKYTTEQITDNDEKEIKSELTLDTPDEPNTKLIDYSETEDYKDNNSVKSEHNSDNDINNIECNTDTVLDVEISKVEKLYKCKKCGKPYAKRKWYLRHIKGCSWKHSPKAKYKVKQYTLSKLQKYIAKGTESTQLFCGLCNNYFNSQTNLSTHLNEHWTNSDLKCMMCDFVGHDAAVLATHRFSHQTTIPKVYQCHICPKISFTLLSLEFHYRSFHLNKRGGFCLICNIEFSKLKNYQRHSKRHGENPKTYICDICGKTFYVKHLIVGHLETHVRKYVCEHCGFCFSRERNMVSHIKAVHTEEKPVKCSHCNKMYKNRNCLRVHLREMYRKKPYKCDVCLKMFSLKHRLETHVISHRDEKPYSCDLCEAKYKRKTHLTVHKNIHAGIMPHKCTYCDRAFPTTTQLKVHTWNHTGTRRYKCDFCPKSFCNKSHFISHCAKLHKKEVCK